LIITARSSACAGVRAVRARARRSRGRGRRDGVEVGRKGDAAKAVASQVELAVTSVPMCPCSTSVSTLPSRCNERGRCDAPCGPRGR